MRLTRQAALAIALVAGLLAALGAWVFIGKQQGKAKPPPEAAMVALPVPLKAIPAWTELHPDMFETVQVKKEQVPVNAVTDLASLDGRIATADLAEKQAVLVGQVAEKTKRLGVAYALNPGVRGMSVSLDVVGAVGDFVQPGNHVDVLSSFEEEGQVVVRTIVQDVLVLALGPTTSVAPPPPATTEGEGAAPEGGAQATPPRRVETPVTLAITPTQAQLILTADKAGDIRLTLRAMGDRSILPLPSAQSWTMIGQVPKQQTGAAAAGAPSASAATPAPGAAATTGQAAGGVTAGGPARTGAGAAPPVKPKKPYVEVIRGDTREYVAP
jgi:pilus assembly protein CpaB